MKQLFLLCNAHLDPVWQWEWEEGASAGVATFRVAAEFCEEYDGFVFCHNEAQVYQWVEEYDAELFARIQNLVKQGKWRIMGGWFLQPDCNLPSGESILRQILVGRKYFTEKFGEYPTCAVSFDAFGHDRGLVQIMKQCGFTSYLIKRPEPHLLKLPGRNFQWQGFDGSTIVTRRLGREYKTLKGLAAQDAARWIKSAADEDISLFTWGVGNHGGGPSREDWVQIKQLEKENADIAFTHGTAEDFFRAIEDDTKDLPVFDKALRPVFVGCYSSQARVKQLHTQLEDMLFSTEKLLTSAAVQGLCDYPTKELEEAQQALLVSQFHDTLPGTTIEPVEKATLHTLGRGMDILSNVRNRGFMAMIAGEEKAGVGEIPLFFYNPHPYPVEGDFSCEFMLEDQNWSSAFRYAVDVVQGGKVLPAQEEKEHSSLTLDWRKRVVFHATLKPSGITRFKCVLKKEPWPAKKELLCTTEPIVIETQNTYVEISTVTGLIDHYKVNGMDRLIPGALATVVLEDTPDPWYMTDRKYGAECGRFQLMTPEETAEFLGAPETVVPSVRIIEDGPVRTVVEALLKWNHSVLVQTYKISKSSGNLELEQNLHWHERDKIAKLEVPTDIYDGKFLGQGMFGVEQLEQDETECISQQWCGMINEEQAVMIIKCGNYGCHCNENKVYISLVRSPAYCAHPIDGRPLIDYHRYLRRTDQGEHTFRFVISAGSADERMEHINWEAQAYHEPPYGLNAFPAGSGKRTESFIEISDPAILLTAMYYHEKGVVVRLWNSTGNIKKTFVSFPVLGCTLPVDLAPYRFATYLINQEGCIKVDPVTLDNLS